MLGNTFLPVFTKTQCTQKLASMLMFQEGTDTPVTSVEMFRVGESRCPRTDIRQCHLSLA